MPDEHSLQVERVLRLQLLVCDRPDVYRLADRLATQHGALVLAVWTKLD